MVTVMRDFVGTCQRTQKAGWEFHLILGRRPQGPLRKCKLATPGGQACGCDRFTEAAPGRRAQGGGRDRRRRRSCCQPRSGAQTPACLVFRWRQNAVRAVDWRVLNESSGHYRRRFRWQARTESAPRARPFGAAVVVVILAAFSLESAASQTLTHCAPRSC